MIRCNYNQVNNCYDRCWRALHAKGRPRREEGRVGGHAGDEGDMGCPVTNAARFVRRPAPITALPKDGRRVAIAYHTFATSGYRVFGHSDYAAHDSAID